MKNIKKKLYVPLHAVMIHTSISLLLIYYFKEKNVFKGT